MIVNVLDYGKYRSLDELECKQLFEKYRTVPKAYVISRNYASQFSRVNVEEVDGTQTLITIGIFLDKYDFPVAFTCLETTEMNETVLRKLFSLAYINFSENRHYYTQTDDDQMLLWFNEQMVTIRGTDEDYYNFTGNQFKIARVSNDCIEFTNDKRLRSEHSQDCCEYNYADFTDIDDTVLDYKLEEPLTFEAVEDYGFRFGNEGKMINVPCYSEQDGYYDSTVTVTYNDVVMLRDIDAKVVLQ